MNGLIKAWEHATMTTLTSLSGAKARVDNKNYTRVANTLQVPRRGSISRMGKTLKRKGLGDLRNPETLRYTHEVQTSKMKKVD
jgi:hypothetical protein